MGLPTVLIAAWLGSLFVYSGMMKLPESTAHRVKIVDAYRLLPHPVALAVGTVLPAAELTVGFLILVGPLTTLGLEGATLLGALFLFASGTALARGIDVSCGCAGKTSSPVTILTVIRAVAITAIAGGLALGSTRSGSLGWAGLAVACAAAVPGALPAIVHKVQSRQRRRDVAGLLKLIGTASRAEVDA